MLEVSGSDSKGVDEWELVLGIDVGRWDRHIHIYNRASE